MILCKGIQTIDPMIAPNLSSIPTNQPEPKGPSRMFTKTILATAAAALLSAGAMAVSTSAADAHYSLKVSGGYYITKYVYVPKTICKTYYETVLEGYDYYNQPIYKQVPYETCKTISVKVKQKVYVPYASYSRKHGLSLHLGY